MHRKLRVCVMTQMRLACQCGSAVPRSFPRTWDSGAAAVRLFPTERRLVADGHDFSLTVSGPTRFYCRPVPALLLLCSDLVALRQSRARVCVCVMHRRWCFSRDWEHPMLLRNQNQHVQSAVARIPSGSWKGTQARKGDPSAVTWERSWSTPAVMHAARPSSAV